MCTRTNDVFTILISSQLVASQSTPQQERNKIYIILHNMYKHILRLMQSNSILCTWVSTWHIYEVLYQGQEPRLTSCHVTEFKKPEKNIDTLIPHFSWLICHCCASQDVTHAWVSRSYQVNTTSYALIIVDN